MSVTATETNRDEIAKRYGSVLFDLAQESKSTPKILKEVLLLSKSLEEMGPKWSLVIRPVVSKVTQREIVEKIGKVLKLGTLMKRFLEILCQNRRLHSLHPILTNFIRRTELSEGAVEGVLETASELSQKQLNDLVKSLKVQMGKDVTLTQNVRGDLLAGVVLRMDSTMIDASLKSRLMKIRYGMKG